MTASMAVYDSVYLLGALGSTIWFLFIAKCSCLLYQQVRANRSADQCKKKEKNIAHIAGTYMCFSVIISIPKVCARVVCP